MTWRRLLALSIVGAAMWLAILIPIGRALAQEAGWQLTYAEGTGNPATGPQVLTWTCPVSGTGAGTVLESDPGNTLTDGTYTDLQVDSGCDPEVGQTLMYGDWTAEIVAVTDPSPPSTTTSTTSTTTTTTVPSSEAWTAGDVEALRASSATTAGALRVIGTVLVMMALVLVWRSYRTRL